MEINRNNYFKYKNKYLIVSIARKIFLGLAIVALAMLIIWAIMLTLFEQKEIYNSLIENRKVISLIVRYYVIVSVSFLLILFIIEKVMHNKLAKQKKILGVIDDI